MSTRGVDWKLRVEAETFNCNQVEARNRMTVYHFSVIVERDADGYYASCAELRGCYTQGDDYEEAMDNIKDAIRLHVEDRLAAGEEIPQPETVSLTSLQVAV